jgi:hypothetical protein
LRPPGFHDELVTLDPIPQIGEVPNDFDFDLSSYSHTDILNLIIFYNQSFEVVQTDNLLRRTEKFHYFIAQI